jgi:hypothetical protein
MTRKNKKQPTTRKPVLIATALLIVICIIFIGNIVHDYGVKNAVLKSKNENESAFDKTRESKVTALLKSGITASSSPDYSSKLDICYVTHSDQGWVATNWYQDCYIRYVDLFRTTLDRQDVDVKLNDAQIFGVPYTLNPRICDIAYEQGRDASVSYLNWQVDPAQQAQYDCRVPKPTQTTFTVRGPLVSDSELSIHPERSFSPEAVDKSKHYVAIESDNFYYHESLGCGFGIACPSPRAKAITGF